MRRISLLLSAFVALVSVCATFSSAALADGDPASDVLAFESIFNPSDLHASTEQTAKLKALVRYVDGHGYPIKIALIGSASDLGTATEYWEDPTDYAGHYLGKELSLIYHGTLLVVMPAGYGLYVPVPEAKIPEGDRRWTIGLVAPGSDLVDGVITQLERLARLNGLTLPNRLAFAAPVARAGSSSAGPLIGFVVGLVAIGATWCLSLRRKPMRKRALA